MPSMRGALSLVACFALLAAACQASPQPSPSASIPLTDLSSLQLPSPTPAPTPAPPTAQPTRKPSPTATELAPTATAPAPTLTAIPLSTASAMPTSATPSTGCVNGWISPDPASAEYQLALSMMDDQMAVTGDWTVDEMRYFTGPDVPWIIDPHYDVVDYWYVRGSLVSKPAFAGRWLLEQRTELIRGISAVAPYTSGGYESPDWTGFTGDGPPESYLGLPGEWAGVPYDFVTGDGDSGEPGLPDEVIGCLSGT